VIWLAYTVIGFTAIQFLVSLINLLFSEKPRHEKVNGNPTVSVLIPARNEEANIANLLEGLQNQAYGNIEIIVFDDMSEDRTAETVMRFAEKDKRIRLIRSSGLPGGWLGKNYACHSLAMPAGGEWLLFLDADVKISGNIIENILGFAVLENLALVSIFPAQEMVTRGEKATVPVMNYILLSLLPLILVRRSFFPSLAAANGQFMFFNSKIYKKELPHKKLKANKVEDIETARMFKRLGYRIACLTGDDTIRCRMYRGFNDAVNGFSKNVACFFGNSLTAAFLFWLITTAGFIPVLLSLPGGFFAGYVAMYVLTGIFVSASSRQSIAGNILYLVPRQLSLGFFIYRAFYNRMFRNYQWKGRSIK